MKLNLLLLDDETLQLELLRQIIQAIKPDYQITAISNPLDALALLEHGSFDTLITDIKMPEMNGLTLVEKLMEMKVEKLKIVILSGFDDFAYAQRAIRYGVTDYLLKPISKDALKNALDRIERHIETSRSTKQFDKTSQSIHWIIYKQMLGLSLSDSEQYIIKKRFKTEERICVALLTWSAISPKPDLQTTIQAKFPNCLIIDLHRNSCCIVFSAAIGINLMMIERFLQSLCDNQTAFGISAWVPIDQSQSAYVSASKMIENAQFLGCRGLCERMSHPPEDVTIAFTPFVNSQSITQNISKLRPVLSSGELSVQECRELVIKMSTEIFKSQDQYSLNAQVKGQLQKELQQKLQQCSTLSETADALTKASAQLLAMHNEDDLFKVNCHLYIRQNFQTDLPLSRIAAHFGYNASYFSYRFSQSFEQGYSKYLTTYRMEQASKLLTETNQTIAQIAKSVGIADNGYFIRVFKEMYQTTPRRYRQHYQSVGKA